MKARNDLGGSPPHPHDMAAANTSSSCEKTKLHQDSRTHSDIMFRSVFTYPSLRGCCHKPSRNSERSASVATPGFHHKQPRYPAQALLMPWSSGVWRSTRSIHIRVSFRQVPQNFMCLIMVSKSKCFVPKSAQLSLPPTRVILMSPKITRSCNHSVGVAICLIRPEPRRIAMARLAVASSLISTLGLSTPSPHPFALTSTPCCCNIGPRSRIIETPPILAAAALTAS